jgi:hypothetical protein
LEPVVVNRVLELPPSNHGRQGGQLLIDAVPSSSCRSHLRQIASQPYADACRHPSGNPRHRIAVSVAYRSALSDRRPLPQHGAVIEAGSRLYPPDVTRSLPAVSLLSPAFITPALSVVCKSVDPGLMHRSLVFAIAFVRDLEYDQSV